MHSISGGKIIRYGFASLLLSSKIYHLYKIKYNVTDPGHTHGP